MAAPVAEWLRPLICSTLNRSSSHRWCCGSEPCSGGRQAKFCLRVVRWVFSGIPRFCPTLLLTEIILTGLKTKKKKKKKK